MPNTTDPTPDRIAMRLGRRVTKPNLMVTSRRTPVGICRCRADRRRGEISLRRQRAVPVTTGCVVSVASTAVMRRQRHGVRDAAAFPGERWAEVSSLRRTRHSPHDSERAEESEKADQHDQQYDPRRAPGRPGARGCSDLLAPERMAPHFVMADGHRHLSRAPERKLGAV